MIDNIQHFVSLYQENVIMPRYTAEVQCPSFTRSSMATGQSYQQAAGCGEKG